MSEQEFEARVLQALEQIDAARGAQAGPDVFRSVLERFARALSRHRAIGAAVRDVEHLPGGFRLVTWPKLRRDQSTPMLNFASQGGSLLLLGEQRSEFRTPDELERFLTEDFLRESAFPDTLAIYEQACAVPVRGFLRRGRPSELSPADVAVRLDPEEQRKLAEATAGADLSVMAHEERVPLSSLFVGEETYATLIAGGYGLWAMFASRAEDGRLRVAGTAMREDELA